MSVTITRTAWIDDDGTGTTGTVLNNAIKTDLYNQIDGALALVAQLTGGNSFTGTQSITGNVIGAAGLNVRNIAAGGAYCQIAIGNDVDPNLGLILGLASTFPAGLDMVPNGVTLRASGVGGLTCSAPGAGAPIRYFTNNAERMRITPAGELCVNATSGISNACQLFVAADNAGRVVALAAQNLSATHSLYFAGFYNNAGVLAGTVQQTSATTVAYNTSSDARLKTDASPAADLTALRGLVVHDFTWTADGVRDRGIFAQDAHALYPRAISPGTDETTESGELARPWMTDYSKFVPDLIVGWQQHAAALEALRAELATLKGSPA
jgi:hypothetical protein